MAHKRSLLAALATARQRKAEKRESIKQIKVAPKRQESEAPELGVIANPKRHLAKECTDQAMLTGWDRAIQKTAYESNISEQEMRDILDQALEYENKADPAGRIEGLQDWQHEKRGVSSLASPKR